MPRAILILAMLAVATPVAAQQGEDPVAEAPMRFGPLGVGPRFGLTNIGVDTNVFNDADDPQSDFTFTASPGVDLWLRLQRGLLSIEGQTDLVYFKDFDSERSVNGSIAATFEYRLNRLRSFVGYSTLNTRERPGFEIDVRARRLENQWSGGVDVRVASKSFVEVAVRRRTTEYDGDAVFGGQPLNRVLNRTLDGADVTWRQNLTVLTTWVLRAGVDEERFDVLPARDNRNLRILTGFDLGRFALIRGSARVGYRRLSPADDGVLPEFSGLVADIDVAYTAPTRTRLELDVRRDVEYSFEDATPYYVWTGWTVSATQQLISRWDLRLFGGRDRLAYEARRDGPASDRVDIVNRLGGGIGYALGEDTRLGFEVASTQRESSLPGRPFRSIQAGASVTYGF